MTKKAAPKAHCPLSVAGVKHRKHTFDASVGTFRCPGHDGDPAASLLAASDGAREMLNIIEGGER